jgi:hypothetical protein
MYFLALVFLLQLDTAPPNILSAPTALSECKAAAKALTEQYKEQLAGAEAKASGAAFVCLKLDL